MCDDGPNQGWKVAIRKKKQKQQVMATLTEIAPPGETFLTCVHVESGPSPWLNGVFDDIPFLGFIMLMTRKFYFLTLTNTSVVVYTATRFRNRPTTLIAAFPIAAFPAAKAKRAAVWSRLYLQLPGQSKPKRLNIHRYWRAELDQLIAALPFDPAREAIGDSASQGVPAGR